MPVPLTANRLLFALPLVLWYFRLPGKHMKSSMKLVCLGDSLTYGYGVRRSAAWPQLAATACGITILNRGISGLLTGGMLARFTKDVVEEKADAVLLMGGANDILSGVGAHEAERTLDVMAKRAEDAGIRPLIGIPPPFCPPIRDDWAAMADFAAATPAYEAFALGLRAVCAAKGRMPVDFRAGMERHIRETGTDPRSLYEDGIHLTEAGHRVFAATLVDALRTAYRKDDPA